MAKFLDDNGLLYLWGKIKAAFVAKESGKGLSANDLTNTLKTNYDAAYTHSQTAHAPAGAEANVQSDWNISDSGSDAFIKNKPDIPAAVIVDSTLSGTSENAIQNKVVKLALDDKVAKNNDITGATKTKITYDAKGLVTGGADLSASDIPDIGATYVKANTKGQPNGVASLGADGLIPSAQLPSFVDDVVELLTMAATAPVAVATGDKYYKTGDKKIYTATATNTWSVTGETPEKSKIYINLATNISYRWGGSDMVQITSTDMVAITNGEIDTVVAS